MPSDRESVLPSRRSQATWGLSLLVALLSGALPARAADLTGHWRDPATGPVFEIVQSGSDVVLTNTLTLRVHQGTIDGDAVELVPDEPPLPDSYSLTVSPDESTLSGVFHTMGCVFSSCYPVNPPVLLERCECFDGNENSGDGCDFQCRVEPCYDCTPSPSACTPKADGTVCDQPGDCFSGAGTCWDGLCEDQAPTGNCADMAGSWLRVEDRFDGRAEAGRGEILQSGGDLSFFELPGGWPAGTGAVNPSTAAVVIDASAAWPFCSGSGFEGSLASGGGHYELLGNELVASIGSCLPLEATRELGMRCADPRLERSDGCLADSCRICEGDPETCAPVADGTPCQSEDPCTVLATCERGECVASIADTCPACSTCNGSGGCTPGPRANCRSTDDPRTTSLLVKHPDSGDRRTLRWKWKKGGAIRDFELARPDLYSDVSFCLFDESATEPTLLYQTHLSTENFGLLVPTTPEWSRGSDGSARYRSRAGSLRSLRLDAGPSGKSRVQLKGLSGPPVPGPVLPTPLRAQVQIEGGACFEGRYAADGVGRNANDVFRAKGTP